MISKRMLKDLLDLGEGWEPRETNYDASHRTLSIQVSEHDTLWDNVSCPHCQSCQVEPHNHTTHRTWRHVNGFNHKCLIECALPRAKCTDCGHTFKVEPRWAGKSKHFTRDFEIFALNLMKEMPVRQVAKLLEETDQRLWRMLFAHVKGARTEFSKTAVNILHQQWTHPSRPWRWGSGE